MSFYAKSVSFWPNEWIFKYSDKIMSCKLWSKVTSVFLNINFCAKLSILAKKKNEFREKCWFFQTIVHYYWKWTSYWKTCLFSENCDFLCDCLYTPRNSNSDKNFNFFLGNVYLYMCMYMWKIVILIQNMILFGDILEKVSFSSYNLHFRWHKFFGEIEQFFEKRC